MVDMVNKMDNVDDMDMENMLKTIDQDCPESNRSDGTQPPMARIAWNFS